MSKFKKIISLSLSIMISAMIITNVYAANAIISRINTPSSWALEQVDTAIEKGLVPQNLQSAYTQAITRAEFSALAVAVYERIKGEITGRTVFIDTSDVNVQKAAYVGIVNGVGNNRFDPNVTLTREQAAVMLTNLANAAGQPFPRQAVKFSDNSVIAAWALDGVGRVQAAGIMGGTGNNNFSPRKPFTREQSIITTLRVYELLKGIDATTTTNQNTNEQNLPQETLAGVVQSINGMTFAIDTSGVFMAIGTPGETTEQRVERTDEPRATQTSTIRVTGETLIVVRTTSGGQIIGERAGTMVDLSLQNVVIVEGTFQGNEFIATKLIIARF